MKNKMKQLPKKISYTDFDKLLLFGGSFLMAELVSAFAEENTVPFVIFSAARHLDAVSTPTGETLRQVLAKRHIRFYESEDINTNPELSKEITPRTLGIALGAAWVFEQNTVARFAPGWLLDFMGIDLPRYRGGAHYTWQILHGNKKGAANLQVILGGRETFHKGPIILSKTYPIPRQATLPKDYFAYLSGRETDFLLSFLREAKKGKTFALRPLREEQSSCYPTLSTLNQGYVDWSWSGEDIARFIAAFDEPYPGASTFIGNRRVFLKSAAAQKSEEHYHPFTSGIVVRTDESAVFVAAKGALLRIGRVLDEKGRDIKNDIKPGSRLFTPSSALDAARQFDAEYGAKGLMSKKKTP